MSVTKFSIGLFVLCVFTSIATAELVGLFPGLKKLIDQSDAIVILRIDRHVSSNSMANDLILNVPHTTHDCYIYETLKGDLPSGKPVRLLLMDARGSFVTPYALNSTHLMFLTKSSSGEPAEYRTLQVEGANILLSPIGHEKMPEGRTLAEKIQNVVRNSMRRSEEHQKKERRFLAGFLRD